MPLHLIFNEISGVVATVLPLEVAMAVLQSILVGALEGRTIGPGFFAIPMLPAFKPLAGVGRTISVRVCAFTMMVSGFPES